MPAGFIELVLTDINVSFASTMAIAPGTVLSRYEIRALVGAGGMGEVYLAHDTRLARPVALKVLRPEFISDKDRLHRFELEAITASSLNHPNIVTIYEIGAEGGVHYIVSEFVEGITLRQQLTRHPPNLPRTLEVVIQVGTALAAAHGKGIVHRDVKPENIMLRHDSYVKLLDFGLAKLTKNYPREAELLNDSSLIVKTDPGVLLGTVKYMSPEQARGLPVDARSDVWSLGVVLYELVTRRLPFTGGTATDVLVSILEREPIPPSRLVPEMPTALDVIVSRATSKAAGERYQTAHDFVADLKTLANTLRPYQHPGTHPYSDPGVTEALTQYLTEPVVSPARARAKTDASSSDRGSRGAPRRRRARKAIDSLAILPLANTGGDPGTEYLSDGITESIINNLAQLPQLRVMARSTVFRYKGRDPDPLSVGRELDVRAVLTGRVLHLGDDLVIKTELVDATDGSLLWGEQYNRKLTDIFAVQDEISREISEKLRFKLTGEELWRLTKRHTDNPEAYQLFLKGRYQWNRRTPQGFTEGIKFFRRAIAADSGYALAYAGLADSYNMLGNYGALPPKEAFRKAKTAATKALRIDGNLAEALTSMAYVKNNYEWDWAGAGQEFRRAIELKPSYATAHYWYAITNLAATGRLNEAMAQMRLAEDLDPLSPIIATNLGWLYYFGRLYDEAIGQFNKVLETDEDFNVVYYKLGQAYERVGRYQEAIESYHVAVRLSGGNLWLAPALGHAYAMAGQRDKARQVLAELSDLSRRRYVSPYFFAEIYRGLGEKDQAFEWLERAYLDRSDWLIWLAVEPGLDSIRSDPRFTSLLRRMRLPEGHDDLSIETSRP